MSAKSDSLMEESNHDLLVESILILAKFTFEKISLGLHSRGIIVVLVNVP